MLKIITVPGKALRLSAKPVNQINDQLKRLVIEMEKTLVAQDDPPGVGLAASQVGENLSLFIIKPSKKAKTQIFINPKILKQQFVTGGAKGKVSTSAQEFFQPVAGSEHLRKGISQQDPSQKISKPTKLEGCLSIPRIWGPVKRAKRLLLQYQDLSGAVKKQWFYGLKAIIIQHEMDHLNGVLFTQRTIEQNLPLYEEKEGSLEKIDDML